jgi:hypothetical protein
MSIQNFDLLSWDSPCHVIKKTFFSEKIYREFLAIRRRCIDGARAREEKIHLERGGFNPVEISVFLSN